MSTLPGGKPRPPAEEGGEPEERKEVGALVSAPER